jgi:putative ABC transport system permease protein
MIISVSWRNIWRNRTRSLVIITAIGLGIFVGVFAVAFMLGWVNQRLDSVINTEVSHIQVHHPRYLESREIDNYIPETGKILAGISDMEQVKAASARLVVNCMIASAETGAGIRLNGIDPQRERLVTDIHEKIAEGDYFEGDASNLVVIGEKLAERLNVGVRSRVVITLAEMDGTLTGGAFRVAGIYKTANTAFDETTVFVRYTELRDLLKIEDGAAHQIAVFLNEDSIEDRVADKLRDRWEGVEVMTWIDLMPEAQLLHEQMALMMYIFVGIILLALAFGIVNTMLMVIIERTKELGMLMAVGMNRIRVFSMVVLESVFLCLTGGAAGMVLALLGTAITGRTGINISMWAEGLEAMGFDSIVYPRIEFDYIVGVTVMVIIAGILSAIYPAIKAIRLNPAEALRIDM